MQEVVSIQSAVAYGYAGNSVVSFVMRRMGVELWPVYTVNFSNHTGYESVHGMAFDPAQVTDIIDGLDERGALASSSALLTGYMGSGAMSEAIVDAAERMKARNPHMLYCCDPVMGDYDKGMYTEAGVADSMRTNVVAHADILIPNDFELDYITGYQATSVRDVTEQMDAVRANGPSVVLTTSVRDPERPENMNMVVTDDHESWMVSTPTIDRGFVGSGDLTSAVFLATYLQTGGDVRRALEHTASAVYSVLKMTDELDRSELALVGAQDELITPRYTFEAHPLNYS